MFQLKNKKQLIVILVGLGNFSTISGSAATFVFDNFEEGSFSTVAEFGRSRFNMLPNLDPSNVATTYRGVFLNGVGPSLPTSASLVLTDQDDQVQLSGDPNAAEQNFTIEYLTGSQFDLTFGGQADRLSLHIESVTNVSDVRFEIVSGEAVYSATAIIDRPGRLDFPFSEFLFTRYIDVSIDPSMPPITPMDFQNVKDPALRGTVRGELSIESITASNVPEPSAILLLALPLFHLTRRLR